MFTPKAKTKARAPPLFPPLPDDQATPRHDSGSSPPAFPPSTRLRLSNPAAASRLPLWTARGRGLSVHPHRSPPLYFQVKPVIAPHPSSDRQSPRRTSAGRRGVRRPLFPCLHPCPPTLGKIRGRNAPGRRARESHTNPSDFGNNGLRPTFSFTYQKEPFASGLDYRKTLSKAIYHEGICPRRNFVA